MKILELHNESMHINMFFKVEDDFEFDRKKYLSMWSDDCKKVFEDRITIQPCFTTWLLNFFKENFEQVKFESDERIFV